MTGFSSFPSSFIHATTLPESERAPTTPAKTIAVEKTRPPSCWPYSSAATSMAAPPPRPLNSATICGIAVILTEYAPHAPSTRPTPIAIAMSVQLRAGTSPPPGPWSCGSTAIMAITMPMAAMIFPRRAVFGEPSSLIPMMNSTAAAR